MAYVAAGPFGLFSFREGRVLRFFGWSALTVVGPEGRPALA